jgi:uncharacterized protein YndB with AHSA1/START domain
MLKLHFSAVINAPRRKVWDTMLDDATYRQWTEAFNPGGSYYEGSWETGSEIRFLGPGEGGKLGGMISRIRESRPHEFVSIQHLGEMRDGKDLLWPESVESFENYTLRDVDGGTELLVDLDVIDEYKGMFEDLWPKALAKLKEMAESAS